jgi:hypothetical protein
LYNFTTPEVLESNFKSEVFLSNFAPYISESDAENDISKLALNNASGIKISMINAAKETALKDVVFLSINIPTNISAAMVKAR